MSELAHVHIHTDGACRGNPGPGGYAAILISGPHRREISGGYARTTNNRMELLAAIHALESLKRPCRVTLHSDSRYLVDSMMRHGTGGANRDLWSRLLALCGRHEVEFVWVRGHDGDPDNERCDDLASAAALAEDLPADPGYPPAASEQRSLFDALVG